MGKTTPCSPSPICWVLMSTPANAPSPTTNLVKSPLPVSKSPSTCPPRLPHLFPTRSPLLPRSTPTAPDSLTASSKWFPPHNGFEITLHWKQNFAFFSCANKSGFSIKKKRIKKKKKKKKKKK